MRARILGSILLSAIAVLGGCTPSARSASGNRDPICVLVDGDLAGWRGLPAHTLDDLPECLGSRKERTSMTYHSLVVDIDYYQPALGIDVWIYGAVADGKVAMIEIRRERPQVVDKVTAALGGPDTTYRWTADDRDASGPAAAFVSRDPDLVVDELVYGGRGLALASARRGDEPPIVFRARGVAPSSADAYLDTFVRVPPAMPQ